MKKGQKYEWFSHSGKTKFTGVFEEIVDFGNDFKEDLKARFCQIKAFPKMKNNAGTRYFDLGFAKQFTEINKE